MLLFFKFAKLSEYALQLPANIKTTSESQVVVFWNSGNSLPLLGAVNSIV